MLIKTIGAVLATLMLVSDSHHIFGTNGLAVLCVPDSDMEHSTAAFADESRNLQVGSGHTPGFRFLFSPQRVRSRIPTWTYVEGPNGLDEQMTALSGTIHFLGSDDQKRLGPAMRARDTEDEWYSTGRCPNSVVTSIENTSLYEVRCKESANYSSIWSRPPNSKIGLPNKEDLLVATCDDKKIGIGRFAGKILSTCKRVTQIEGFLVDYAFQEQNVGVIPEVEAFIRDKILEWKRNCSI
jgi:hypothetical protein